MIPLLCSVRRLLGARALDTKLVAGVTMGQVLEGSRRCA
jgi:hypothetical protein